MDGWMGGWVGGWVGGWMAAVLCESHPFFCLHQVADSIIDLYEAIYKDNDIGPFEKLEKQWMVKQAKSSSSSRTSRRTMTSSPGLPLLFFLFLLSRGGRH